MKPSPSFSPISDSQRANENDYFAIGENSWDYSKFILCLLHAPVALRINERSPPMYSVKIKRPLKIKHVTTLTNARDWSELIFTSLLKFKKFVTPAFRYSMWLTLSKIYYYCTLHLHHHLSFPLSSPLFPSSNCRYWNQSWNTGLFTCLHCLRLNWKDPLTIKWF